MRRVLCLGSGLLLALSTAVRADVVNFSTFVTASQISTAVGQNNVIGFTYAGNKFVGSLYLGTFNDQLYQTSLDGSTVTPFGTPIPNGFQGEVVVAASLGQGGFNSGDIYAGASDQIYKYANSGGSPTLFATLPDGATVRGILFDPGSSFGGDMLVTDNLGHIYKIDGAGNITLLASTGEDTEGMDIAGSNWGPYAGDLLVASEGSGNLRFINPSGTIDFTSSTQGLTVGEAEVVSFVPTAFLGNPAEGYYEANYAQNIQVAPPSDFSTLGGDVLVSEEFGSNAPILAFGYSGNAAAPFAAVGQVGALPNQAEDGIFVTAQRITDITSPEPSAVVLLFTLVLGLGLMWRRKQHV